MFQLVSIFEKTKVDYVDDKLKTVPLDLKTLSVAVRKEVNNLRNKILDVSALIQRN